MKRDMDLVREILLAIESFPFDGDAHEILIQGRSQDEVAYHLKLLCEAGLIGPSNILISKYAVMRSIYAVSYSK